MTTSGQAPSPAIEVAELWMRLFNLHDVDGVVRLYAEDGRHSSPRIRQLHPDTGGEVIGRAALARWWRDALLRTPELRYETLAIAADGSRAFVEYVRHAPGEPDAVVVERFEVGDGHILSSRVFLG
jgi:limonene-1,2-epoxide hydrolase